MSKFKIKVICGFRKEQEYTIDANEAHKAYYLFNNPTNRGTFDTGVAIKGSDIQRIVPDFHATMGWNDSHVLTGDDHNVLHAEGVSQKLAKIMATAKEVGRNGDVEDMKLPLLALYRGKYAQLDAGSSYAQELLGGKK
jgi:hypothetical protein